MSQCNGRFGHVALQSTYLPPIPDVQIHSSSKNLPVDAYLVMTTKGGCSQQEVMAGEDQTVPSCIPVSIVICQDAGYRELDGDSCES
jgi:hypothetical protein